MAGGGEDRVVRWKEHAAHPPEEHRMSAARLTRLVLALAGALALLVASTGLAGAQGPPADRPEQSRAGEQGPPADKEPAGPSDTTETEDTDSNDDTPNNVVDDGDDYHPSGKDRSVEPGGSGNQGKAAHDPDDDGNGPDNSNGGLDQPDGPGGDDLADQDGNNGCGNDDDFEDDNEGRCLGREGAPGQQPDDDDEVIDDDDDEEEVIEDDDEVDEDEVIDEDVLHEGEERDDEEQLPAILDARGPGAPEAAVLGVSQTRTPGAVGSLARTGTDAQGTLIPLGVSLLLLGAALEVGARRRTAGVG
jgi:hypothetical protein